MSTSSSPLVSSLHSLFTQASLQVSLAGLTEAERSRDIAFYDETVVTAIRLSIPASDKTLPFPLAHTQSSFSLPLSPSIADDDDDDDFNVAPPKLLSLLVAALQISLEASYTAPRLGSTSSSSSTASAQPEASTSSNYLIPASHVKDSAYQNVPLYRNSSNGEVTQMFTASWNGAKVPEKVEEKGKAKTAGKGEDEEIKNGGEIWYVEDKGEGKWVTEWRCKVPITYMRSRHPTPALLLTASMMLRLQPSRLSRLAPSLVPPPVTSASESLYLHDLLTSLSEGPSYPDESPAERAARANASLARLPLGKLPSSILGSKLVTPARNAKEVGQIIAEKTTANATENGDMGDSKDGRRYGGRGEGRPLTNEGLMAFQVNVEGGIKSLSADDQAKGLGEELVVLQRSARRVLDVQSAILVRMRTISIPGLQNDDEEGSLVPTLILCVEVENPINSGIKFALDSVDVAISLPMTSGVDCQSDSVDVSMRRMGKVWEPEVIEQGNQSNLLFQMVFDYSEDGVQEAIRPLGEPHRSVSISLLGRPVLLFEQDGQVQPHTPTRKFVSTWSCMLDLSPQLRMVALQRVMHGGAGGDRFGPLPLHGAANAGQRQRLQPQQQPQRTASVSSHATAAPGPHLALPASPFSPLPRTPSEMQSASTYLASSSTPHMMSLQRPSFRAASTGHGEALVSLHRSDADCVDTASPALPSALVGQSILARARLNRSTTIASGKAEESRQLLKGKRSQDWANAKGRTGSEQTVTPTQPRGPPAPPAFSSFRGARTGAETDDGGTAKDTLLPLADKRSTATVQRLLTDATKEQGLLIDVVAFNQPDAALEAAVQVQVENRSSQPKTFIISWQTAKAEVSSFQADEDEIQVGPLHRGDSETITLTLRFTNSGLHQLPPLAVYDTSSGIEKVLEGMQSIVV